MEVENMHEYKKAVVHAYGLGGRGYELSWGVALEVLLTVKVWVASRTDLSSS